MRKSKFNEICDAIKEDYSLYDPDFIRNDIDDAIRYNPKLQELDTININFISNKNSQNTNKSDTARDYIVTKISKDGKKITVEPKQKIHSVDLETGEDVIDDEGSQTLDISDKEKAQLIFTTNPGVWMMTYYVDSEPIHKKQIEESTSNVSKSNVIDTLKVLMNDEDDESKKEFYQAMLDEVEHINKSNVDLSDFTDVIDDADIDNPKDEVVYILEIS